MFIKKDTNLQANPPLESSIPQKTPTTPPPKNSQSGPRVTPHPFPEKNDPKTTSSENKSKKPAPFRSLKDNQQKDRLKVFLNQYRENEQAWAYTETALTIFLVVIFIFFAIRPAAITVTGLLSEIKAKETLVLKIRKKINSTVQAQDTYSQVQSRYKVLESFLPDTPRYTHTATQVQGVSQDTNLSLDQVSFTIPDGKKTEKTTQSNVVPVVFSLNTSSSYQNILNFLERIIKNRRLLTPQEITLSQSKKELKDQPVKEGEILINLKGNSYYWNE